MLSSFFRIILVLQNLYRSFKAKINYTHELKYISYFLKILKIQLFLCYDDIT